MTEIFSESVDGFGNVIVVLMEGNVVQRSDPTIIRKEEIRAAGNQTAIAVKNKTGKQITSSR